MTNTTRQRLAIAACALALGAASAQELPVGNWRQLLSPDHRLTPAQESKCRDPESACYVIRHDELIRGLQRARRAAAIGCMRPDPGYQRQCAQTAEIKP